MSNSQIVLGLCIHPNAVKVNMTLWCSLTSKAALTDFYLFCTLEGCRNEMLTLMITFEWYGKLVSKEQLVYTSSRHGATLVFIKGRVTGHLMNVNPIPALTFAVPQLLSEISFSQAVKRQMWSYVHWLVGNFVWCHEVYTGVFSGSKNETDDKCWERTKPVELRRL